MKPALRITHHASRIARLPFLLLALPAAAADPSPNLELARQLNQAFVEVAEKVSPAVVVITITQKAMDEVNDSRFGALPPEFRRRLHQEFEDSPPPELRGQGSGVIIRDDGYILTNGHVVEDADTIQVRLQDRRTFKAKVRGVDPKSDVAVIKIEAKGLPVATLTDSTRTRVGEFAIAIGAPFNLDYTVTYGHVSAKSRSNVIVGDEGATMDQDFIQTDANINPGNSGGPLVNINGEVIGINTLIRGLHTGIGFAIPSSLAKEVSDQLIAEGKFTRLWLGIGTQAVRDTPDFQTLVKGIDDGVIVSTILTNGPAYKSELKPRDVITAVDGKRVSTVQQLRNELRVKKIGEQVTLDVIRLERSGHGKTLKVKIKPAEWEEPPVTVAAARRPLSGEADPAALGLTVHPLTPEIAKYFAIETTNGIIVLEVKRGTPADRQGIIPGDLITGVDQQPVANTIQFYDAIKKANLKKGIVINLTSGGTARFEILKEAGE